MRVAICFSGVPTTLDRTHKSLRKTFDRWFGKGNYDIFVFMPPNKYTRYVTKYFPEAEVKIKPDEYIEYIEHANTGVFHRGKEGVQAYLQQINGYKQVNRMRIEKEKRGGFTYDFVVRARMDLQFIFYNLLLEKNAQNRLVNYVRKLFWRFIFSDNPLKKDSTNMTALLHTEDAKHTLYIPNFSHDRGYNDNFCIGPPQLMDIYMNVLDIYFRYPTKCDQAEFFLKYCLDMHNVDVTLVNLLYRKIKIVKTLGFTKKESMSGNLDEVLNEKIGFCPWKEGKDGVVVKLHRFITEIIPFYWKRFQKRSIKDNVKSVIRVLGKK